MRALLVRNAHAFVFQFVRPSIRRWAFSAPRKTKRPVKEFFERITPRALMVCRARKKKESRVGVLSPEYQLARITLALLRLVFSFLCVSSFETRDGHHRKPPHHPSRDDDFV